jgi:hypothetical protein
VAGHRRHLEVLAGKQIEILGLVADKGQKAQVILNTGLVLKQNSLLSGQLRAAILDGAVQRDDLRSVRGGLARALSPRRTDPRVGSEASLAEVARDRGWLKVDKSRCLPLDHLPHRAVSLEG